MSKMSEMKIKDPAMYAAIKGKKDAKKAAKRAALAKLIAFAAEKGTPELQAIAKALTTRAPSTGGTRAPSFLSVLGELFKGVVGATVSEEAVFKTHRMGRGEMRKFCINAIKKAKPADRLWVSFDLQTGVYKLEGVGVAAPANWKGYRPLVVDGAEVK